MFSEILKKINYNSKEIPKNQIDHINGNKSDNRIENLREVTNRQNNLNKLIHISGKLPGCYLRNDKKSWSSSISISGKSRYLGSYKTEQEAHTAYLFAAILYGVQDVFTIL